MMFIFIPSIFLFPPVILSSGSYTDSGIITSTNILPLSGTSMMNSFTYNASAIPAGTSLKMQYSYDGIFWYSSTGVVDTWDTLSAGENTIDLSSMGWKKPYFFYRVLFGSDGNVTPVLNSVSIAFTSFDGTFNIYSSSGTLTSNNLLSDAGVSSINSFGYTLSSLPPDTSIQIQFSQDGNSWYSSAGVLNGFNILSTGTNNINLADLSWNNSFYYRTILTSSDGLNTPVLNGVTLSYTSSYYYWVGGPGGSWNNSANWSGTSGGTGGAGIPNETETAIFDSGNTNSANINTNISIGNIKIKSGYTGTITEATSSTITMSGTTTVSGGTLVLAGTNSILGGVVLNGGVIDINNAGAIGTSTLTITGGTIDNTSGGPITLSANNSQNWNGSFTLGGTNVLNFGTGTITLGTTTTVTINGTSTTLVIDAVVSGAYGLTKAGAGSLTLNRVNTHSGGTTLSGGTLNINNSSAFGSGVFSQTGGALKVYGSTTIVTNSTITSGTVDFCDNSIFNGVMSIATGHTANFNNSSYNTGIINGDAKFAYATSGTVSLSNGMVWGTVTGVAKGLSDNASIVHWVFNGTSFNNGTTTVASSSTMSFYDTSYNSGTINVLSGGITDFYNNSTNIGKINIASGGILNFYDSSSNNNGTISVASNGSVNFYDSSFNKDGVSTVAINGRFDFYEYSYNNGTVSGNVVFHNDIPQNIGTVNGSTTREYDINTTTTRNFTTDGGHNDWIIIAKGVIVDISNAIYSLATNIFKALSNGFFIIGSNIAGGPVVPQLVITSPVSGVNIKWTPNISWETNNLCQYKIDEGNYINVNCASNGVDIPRPSATGTSSSHTIFFKSTDVQGNIAEKFVVFSYDNTQPVWTSCGSDLLDEATRPYYYLTSNVGNCTVTASTTLRGDNNGGGSFFTAGSVTGAGTSTNIGFVNVTATGTISNFNNITVSSSTLSGSIDVVGIFNSDNKSTFGNTTVESGGVVNGGSFVGSILNKSGGTIINSTTSPVTVASSTTNNGTIFGDFVFNATSTNTGVVNGNLTLNASSTNTGTVNGDLKFNMFSATSGSVSFNGTTSFAGTGRVAGLNKDSLGNVITRWTFNDQSSNAGYTVGDSFFNGTSSNASTVFGNAYFGSSSINAGTVTGNADVYYIVFAPIGGTVNGVVTYHAYPNAISFNNVSGDRMWGNSSNWFTDVTLAIPLGRVPTTGEDVVLFASTTLPSDVTNNVYVATSDILLNGAGHTLTGNVSGNGAYGGYNAFNFNLGNITVTGTSTAIGGDGIPGVSDGGDGGTINIDTASTGEIVVNGGDPLHNGGNAGTSTISNSFAIVDGARILAVGGASSGCGFGGNGGNIFLIESSGYVLVTDKGVDATSTCVVIPPTPAGRSGGNVSQIGIYVSPATKVALAAAAAAVNNRNLTPSSGSLDPFFTNLANRNIGKLNLANLPSVGLGNFGLGNLGTSKFINPLADLLQLQPVGGFNPLPTINLAKKLSNFLNSPLPQSLVNLSKSVPFIKKELISAGIINGHDLYIMKESPINTPTLTELAKDKTKQPESIIFVSLNKEETSTKLSIDKKGNLYQTINVLPQDILTISAKNSDKKLVVTLDGETIKVIKDKKNIVKLSIVAPKDAGIYSLKVGLLKLRVRVEKSVAVPENDSGATTGLVDVNNNKVTETQSTKNLSPIQKLWVWFRR